VYTPRYIYWFRALLTVAAGTVPHAARSTTVGGWTELFHPPLSR
jgi:hypothetical protein